MLLFWCWPPAVAYIQWLAFSFLSEGGQKMSYDPTQQVPPPQGYPQQPGYQQPSYPQPSYPQPSYPQPAPPGPQTYPQYGSPPPASGASFDFNALWKNLG